MYDGNWTNGKVTGTLAMYDKNGQKYMERHYSTNGKFESNDSNVSGTAPDEQTQTNSPEYETFTGSGKYTLYNRDGTIQRKGYFENGKLINGEHFIYKDGKQIRKDVYKNGKKL